MTATLPQPYRPWKYGVDIQGREIRTITVDTSKDGGRALTLRILNRLAKRYQADDFDLSTEPARAAAHRWFWGEVNLQASRLRERQIGPLAYWQEWSARRSPVSIHPDARIAGKIILLPLEGA